MEASHAKRPRIGSDTNGAGAASGIQLVAERTVALPPDIGLPSAIATWVPAGTGGSGVLVIGTCTGGIALMHDGGDTTVLETPGGAAIQALLAKAPGASADGADTKPVPEVVAGDADGHVTVYTLGRRFSRITLPAPVSALAADSNPNAPSSFLVGDMGGAVASCHAQETIWRAHIDALPAAASLRAPRTAGLSDPMVTGVCSVWQPDKHGLLTNYVLVASGHGHIQLLTRGMPVHTIPLACPCTSLCPGVFISRGQDGDDRRLGSGAVQAVLGDEAGRLFVLDNFELVPYAQLDHPIVRVAALPLQSREGAGVDAVVCQTSSDTVYVLHGGRTVATYTAGFWPAAVGVAPDFGGAGPVLAVADPGEPTDSGSGGSSSIHIVPLRPLLDSIGL
ncbi:hypothetical protein H4R19_005775 [Coemansia spiralis]|nr:hypothetical protein H4R19_005775 [Coemansia spiralis]